MCGVSYTLWNICLHNSQHAFHHQTEVTWISELKRGQNVECGTVVFCVGENTPGSLCFWFCSMSPLQYGLARHLISMTSVASVFIYIFVCICMFLYFKAGWNFPDCFSGVRRNHRDHSSNVAVDVCHLCLLST